MKFDRPRPDLHRLHVALAHPLGHHGRIAANSRSSGSVTRCRDSPGAAACVTVLGIRARSSTAWERKRHKRPLSVRHGARGALGFIVGPTYSFLTLTTRRDSAKTKCFSSKLPMPALV